MRIENEISSSEITEKMVSQNQIGTEWLNYGTLRINMMEYNSNSLTGNEIGSSEMRGEMVEQNHSEIESEYATLTVDGILGCNLESCVGNEIDGMAEQNQSETGGESSEYVTFSVGMCSEPMSVSSFVKMLKIFIYITQIQQNNHAKASRSMLNI